MRRTGRLKRPAVLLRCVADQYAGAGERIIEVSSRNGGALISLQETQGELHISVYRADKTVQLMRLGRM